MEELYKNKIERKQEVTTVAYWKLTGQTRQRKIKYFPNQSKFFLQARIGYNCFADSVFT